MGDWCEAVIGLHFGSKKPGHYHSFRGFIDNEVKPYLELIGIIQPYIGHSLCVHVLIIVSFSCLFYEHSPPPNAGVMGCGAAEESGLGFVWVMGCGAAEATDLGFVCFFLLLTLCVVNQQSWFGLLFHKFSNFTPPTPWHSSEHSSAQLAGVDELAQAMSDEGLPEAAVKLQICGRGTWWRERAPYMIDFPL